MAVSVKPLTPSIGAEVSGVDARNIGPDEAKVLVDAFLEHHVVLVRGSTISDDELVRFGECFGHLEAARMRSPLASRQEIMVISNIRENGQTVGALPDGEMSFHFDRLHQKQPNKAGVLHALEIPRQGGDTCFSNMCLAYDTLPESTKKRIEGLTAFNTFEYGTTNEGAKKLSADAPAAVHPVVRRIPETGRKALYVCRLMTDRINELEPDESRELLEELFDHVEKPDFVYAHKWTVGDILIWDNRCTIHARTDFDGSERRLMKRVTVGDNTPPLH